MRAVAFLVLAGLMSISPAWSTSRVKTPFVVGNWYGERQPYSPNVMWLSHFRADGRFSAQFRECVGNKVREEQTISGTWSIKNGEWILVTTQVNGIAIHSVNAYKTQSYDGRKHSYLHRETGFVFAAVRVGAEFKLPVCQLTG